jgi:outer membrane protein OmpA-like peptidoglycan-associated protein
MPANDPHPNTAGAAPTNGTGNRSTAQSAGSHGAAHGASGPPHGHSEEHHEGAPEWMISFADNTALIMGFFVIMLAMTLASAVQSAVQRGGGQAGEGGGTAAGSIVPTPEVLDIMNSIRIAFNNPVDPNNPAPGEEAMAARLRQLLAGNAEDVGIAGDKRMVQALRDTDYHALSGFVLFEARSTELTPQAEADLKRFASLTKGLRLIIDIRAHVSAAEAYGQEDHGIRFSLERGLAVAKYLTKEGLDWRQLRVIPQGDTDPIQTRAYDATTHGQNACVEFRVSNELVKQ